MIHYQKPSDLDLHHFQKSVYNFEEAMHIVHLFCRILFSKAELFKNAEAFVFLFSKNMLVYRVGICKMLVGIATREDPYQTSRGGSRISGKGVHIYNSEGGGGGGGVGFANFISFFKLFHFHRIFKKWGRGMGFERTPWTPSGWTTGLLILVWAVCLCFFVRQLLFKILDYLTYWAIGINVSKKNIGPNRAGFTGECR